MQVINDYINSLEVINTQCHDNLTITFLRGVTLEPKDKELC